MNGPRVAVIGGGLAGLAAASALQSLGAQPTVFEAADEVGGVVRSIRRGEWLFDTGAALAAEPEPAVRVMLDGAGLEACTLRALPEASNRFIVRNGAPVPLPRTASEFTASPLLSLAGRLRLLKERLIPARQSGEDESVDAFARRRFGVEVAERVFDPLVLSTCAGDPAKILARYAFPSAAGNEREGGSALQGSARAGIEARRRARGKPRGSWSCVEGMQQLARQLAASLADVRVGVPIRRVAERNGGFAVTVAGSPDQFARLVFAVPAPAFATIDVAMPDAGLLADIATMPHASVAAVTLGYANDQVRDRLDGSRLLIPSVEGRGILSIVFQSASFPARAPRDHLLFTVYIGGALHPIAEASPDELLALARREAEQLLGACGTPAIHDVTVWRDALPQAVAGHEARLVAADRIESLTEGRAVFTGSWRDGLSIGEVLRGGMRAASRTMQSAN